MSYRLKTNEGYTFKWMNCMVCELYLKELLPKKALKMTRGVQTHAKILNVKIHK